MHTFSTLVLYERHGRAAIGYRAEMIDQIARGDIAEGSRGAWELRCWTPANESPRHGVTADELTALVNAVFRTTSYCVGNSRPSNVVQRFHCGHSGFVVDLPDSLPLAEHLALWSNDAKLNDAFLQARHLDTDQLFAVRHELQQEIEAMVSVKDELCGQFPTR